MPESQTVLDPQESAVAEESICHIVCMECARAHKEGESLFTMCGIDVKDEPPRSTDGETTYCVVCADLFRSAYWRRTPCPRCGNGIGGRPR